MPHLRRSGLAPPTPCRSPGALRYLICPARQSGLCALCPARKNTGEIPPGRRAFQDDGRHRHGHVPYRGGGPPNRSIAVKHWSSTTCDGAFASITTLAMLGRDERTSASTAWPSARGKSANPAAKWRSAPTAGDSNQRELNNAAPSVQPHYRGQAWRGRARLSNPGALSLRQVLLPVLQRRHR